MSVVVPYGDPAYLRLRGPIAVPEGALLQKDTLSGCIPTWRRWSSCGSTAGSPPFTPTGLKVPNRSHFSAMEEVEDADPGSDIRRGLGQPSDRARLRRVPDRGGAVRHVDRADAR